ncbi:Secondary metabolism regulator LAE1 [Colletotrichum trifolii]|uniref:Secondary metabolism regulator LAE1 n=1 Tax=Colletotrichum trifolii TaxID=5466 RepID=A0A4V3HX08_COLTR|nr:Secondary metabolism regulator LAE1 [Colletotrichum trifolii]
MPKDDKLKAFYEMVVEAFAGLGLDLHKGRDLKPHLEAAGFKDIRCEVKKIPVGTWPKDKTQRLIGLYLKEAVEQVAPAFTGKPFEAHGIPRVESEVWLATVTNELKDNTKHRYLNFYFWYAQKPLDAPEHDHAGPGSSSEDEV